MRHKTMQSQIEPRRVPRGRQHTPSLEAFNADHCIFQETVFVFFAGAPGLFFTVAVTVSTQYPQLHPEHPQPKQLLWRDGLHGLFFFRHAAAQNTRPITLSTHFLSTHDRTMTKAVGRMQQTNELLGMSSVLRAYREHIVS